jgi:hypothetical protein
MAKRVKESASESEIVKVVDPVYEAPADAEEQRALPPPAPSRQTTGQRVRRLVELLVRLLSWVIIFTIFGAALYYGLPMLYQKFVAPVEQNTAQMLDLQSRLQQAEQEVAGLQTRLESLEANQTENTETLTQLNERVSGLETEIEARTKSLAALEEMQAELQTQNESTSSELQRQIKVLKAMELMSRARLFMYQSNYGLSRQDVQIARDLLADVQLDAPASLAHDLDAVTRRLDLVLSSLPDFPVAASDDLDIAWQILLSGMPKVPVKTDATAVPGATLSATPAVTRTRTPQGTVPPTVTP